MRDGLAAPTSRGTFPRSLLESAGVVAAARALLGAVLVREDDQGRRAGRIVEVEAYAGPEDRASHARFGPHGRSAVIFGQAGAAYVYLVYGMHHCLNVVAGPIGAPSAILIRAVEPRDGIQLMRLSRASAHVATRRSPPPDARAAAIERFERMPAARLASGPGLVCASFGIDRSWTGIDLCDPGSPLRLEIDPAPDDRTTAPFDQVVASPRIGVAYAGDPWATVPWRFHLAGSPAVSGRRGAE